MKFITWKNDKDLIAGTSLRLQNRKEANNLALHVCENIENILENRKQFSDALGIDINSWVYPQQTHSDHIKEVTKQDCGKGVSSYTSGIPDCDAIYTKDKLVALGVFHADCVPILLYDPIQQIICAIHSGWQGTVKEITAKALDHLIQKEGCKPQNMLAYIGPAIGFNSFEVEQDVLQQVQNMSFPTEAYIAFPSSNKALVDCKGLNKQMLLNKGLLSEHITVDKNDTYQNNDVLFSYRRDPSCGRHVTFIMRK